MGLYTVMKSILLTVTIALFSGVECGDDGEAYGSLFPQVQWRPPTPVVSQRYFYSRSSIPGELFFLLQAPIL